MNTTLIEINTNPCLEESNTLLKHMLPRMLDDLLNLTMDPLFYSSDQSKYKSAFPLPGSVFQDMSSSLRKPDPCPHPGFRNNENIFKLVHTMDC